MIYLIFSLVIEPVDNFFAAICYLERLVSVLLCMCFKIPASHTWGSAISRVCF